MSDTDHVQPLDRIQSYHAHIYFNGAEERAAAERLRADIAERFSVFLGRWHDVRVGPHMRSMYQVAFSTGEFARFVPWLMLNRRGLSVLIHPNTGYPKSDHLNHAMWMGENLGVHAEPLPEHDDEAEPEIIPNTQPTVTP